MTLKYNKVNLATIDEFKSFCSNNPNIKYIDAILTDLSGIIRGKRLPIEDAEKHNSWFSKKVHNLNEVKASYKENGEEIPEWINIIENNFIRVS